MNETLILVASEFLASHRGPLGELEKNVWKGPTEFPV